jgi:hypothetical protein
LRFSLKKKLSAAVAYLSGVSRLAEATWERIPFDSADVLPINCTYSPGIASDASGNIWLFGGSYEVFSLFDETDTNELWRLNKGSQHLSFSSHAMSRLI